MEVDDLLRLFYLWILIAEYSWHGYDQKNIERVGIFVA